MHRVIILLMSVMLFFACPTLAVLLPDQITESETDCLYPSLASSDDGVTMLAYVVKGDPIPMDFVQVRALATVTSDAMWYTEPETLNNGGRPTICWSRTGFHCAFVSGPVIIVYHSLPDFSWDHENYSMIATNGPVLGIDLFGVHSDAAGPDVFMAVHTITDQPDGDHHVMYASHTHMSGWSELSWVATETEMYSNPQITWDIGPAGPWPTIFYIGGDQGNNIMKHTTYDFENGWSSPEVVPGDGVSTPSSFSGEFDVITRWGMEKDILGLGAQPTCPCGTIHHQSYEPGFGWQATTNQTINYAHYDWPRSPNLATDPEGRLHAFWQQLSSTHTMEPWHTTMEYRIYDDGVWEDQNHLIYGSTGYRNIGDVVALAVAPSSHPVVAWTERDTIDGIPQPSQVIVARDSYLSSAPEQVIVKPELKLSAWPNPFNPRTTISYELMAAAKVTLGIYDVAGHLIKELIGQENQNEGHHTATWSGRNSQGQSVPSGTYFYRLEAGGLSVIKKVSLLR